MSSNTPHPSVVDPMQFHLLIGTLTAYSDVELACMESHPGCGRDRSDAAYIALHQRGVDPVTVRLVSSMEWLS